MNLGGRPCYPSCVVEGTGPARRERLGTGRALILLALAVVLFALPMFAHLQGIASSDEFRNNDWLNCRSFDVLSRRAILQDGELPLRTHLLGGGFPVIAHPSDGSWAPTLLAVLAFGDVVGVKVNILLLLLAGAWGTWLLARRWLGLEPLPALFAALLFAFSGWAPSMLLVGFYNQVFYLLVPPILYLLLTAAGRPARLLLASLLLAFVLQQGGHAFPAIVYFLGLSAWLVAASEDDRPVRAIRRWGPPMLLLLGLTAPMAIARGARSAWPLLIGWALAIAAAALVPDLRRFARRLLPWAGRLALLLVVTCSLGAARIVGLSMLTESGRYEHVLQRKDAIWFPDAHGSPFPEERFYEGPLAFVRGLAGRAPTTADYALGWGRTGDPTDYEYAFLGLTPPPLLLALLGLLFAFGRPPPRRRTALVAILSLTFAAICFGWWLPPDFHFLLTWGVPTLHAFAQPLKYWNFFVLLGLVLLAGWGLQRGLAWLPEGRAPLVAAIAALALLAWPFAQNRVALAELFEHERPAEPELDFHQVMSLAEAWWTEVDLATIRQMSDELHLRDYVRPPTATEYTNIRRGVGTIDHYGSVVMTDELAVPKTFVTLAGREVPNPTWRGEAWLEGEGRITRVHIGHNDIALEVALTAPARVVVNQNHLPGFGATVGTVVDHEGLLAVDLPAGEHALELRYRPTKLIAGLATSAGSLVAWIVAMGVLLRRRRW